MSRRYRSGYLTLNPPAAGTPNKGIWTADQQFSARGQGIWPAPPTAPTIGTATAGLNTCVSVAFTPGCTGYPTPVTYTATSSPGGITATGAASPIVVTGLTAGTCYTFTVTATNPSGLPGATSGPSNTVKAAVTGQQVYSSAAGTFTWVAPANVTKVSVLVIGGGANSGSGGGLRYLNNYSVTPGSSYTVVVGAGGGAPCVPGGQSYFVNNTLVRANGGTACSNINPTGVGGCGGGGGGARRLYYNAGGGGPGYSGNGGGAEQAGSGGGGGGGSHYGGGGGVGLFGQGANGNPGTGETTQSGGYGGSGGCRGGASNPANNYGGAGGLYGAGGGAGSAGNAGKANGARGAVRIVWPGCVRRFPSTCVGNF